MSRLVYEHYFFAAVQMDFDALVTGRWNRKIGVRNRCFARVWYTDTYVNYRAQIVAYFCK